MASTPMDAVRREVRLRRNVLRYRDVGEGPVLVIVHGILVNGELWREAVDELSGRFRCVVPDLPLGAHAVPLAVGTEPGPRGVATLVADLMERLELEDVTLVGNDTGGAVCQVVISERPERVRRLVLTNCDAYEDFFPPLLRPFQWGARFFGGRFTDLLAWGLGFRFVGRLLFRVVVRRYVADAKLDGYLGPVQAEAGVRRDLTGLLRRISNRYTLDAARTFPRFRRPVLIVWGEDDIFFSARLARRLRDDFPRASLVFVPRSRALVPFDQPLRLAREIAALHDGRTDETI